MIRPPKICQKFTIPPPPHPTPVMLPIYCDITTARLGKVLPKKILGRRWAWLYSEKIPYQVETLMLRQMGRITTKVPQDEVHGLAFI